MLPRKTSKKAHMKNNAPTAKDPENAGIAKELRNAGRAREQVKSIRGIFTMNSSAGNHRKAPRNEEKTGMPYYP
jgi:hypothetical protein